MTPQMKYTKAKENMKMIRGLMITLFMFAMSVSTDEAYAIFGPMCIIFIVVVLPIPRQKMYFEALRQAPTQIL